MANSTMGVSRMMGVVKEKRGPGSVTYREVAEPAPQPGQVKVAVTYAGICGSDLHILHDQIGLALRPPVVLGHEFVGHIVEFGDDSGGWQIGDRVVSETAFAVCGTCSMCMTGHDNVCAKKELIGFVHNGAFAQFLVLPVARLHRPDERLKDREAAMAEPVAGCVHAVMEQCGVIAGDLVVIVGPGTVGLIDLQLAKASGAQVILCGRSEHRLRLGSQLGADYVVNLDRSDPRELVAQLSGGYGCDTFMECAGTSESVALGLSLLRRRGRFLQQGLIADPAPIRFDEIAYKEIEVVGTLGQKWSAWERGLALMARGLVQVEPLISDVLPMSAWEKAFGLVGSRAAQKVLLQPDAVF